MIHHWYLKSYIRIYTIFLRQCHLPLFWSDKLNLLNISECSFEHCATLIFVPFLLHEWGALPPILQI